MGCSKMHKLFIVAVLTFSIASTALSCFTPQWDIFVISAIPNNIVVHIKSGDDDLGNHTIPFNENYTWSFCDRFVGQTVFYSYFWWGSRFKSLDLFNKNIEHICFLYNMHNQHCYWLVKPDGFYVSAYPDKLQTIIDHWD